MSENSIESRQQYWNRRYSSPDWDMGIHIGHFQFGSSPSLSEACAAADVATSRTILESCSLYRLTRGLRVLEIGCGSGGLAVDLCQRVPRVEYVGYDVAASAIEAAGKRAASNLLSTDKSNQSSAPQFRVGDVAVARTDLENGRIPADYDVIIVREVFYLLDAEERSEVVRFTQQNLRLGGVVIFADLFSVGEVSPAVMEHLYRRHRARGEPIRLSDNTDAAVAAWCEEVFGNGLRPVTIRIDREAISRTYRLALEECEGAGVAPENEAAYRCLADAVLDGPTRPSSLVYVETVLFRDELALDDVLDPLVDFTFRPVANFRDALRTGELYGVKANAWNLIVGRSGGGKTTILRALQGDLKGVLPAKQIPLAGRRYFVVPQDVDVFESFSPIDNVRAFGSERRSIDALLAKLGLSEPFRNRKNSFKISGGEKQRLALAQSVVAQPEVILLDEPLKGLDVARRTVLFDLLKEELSRAQTADLTVVCTDHAFDLIEREFQFVFEVMFGRQVLMSQGA